MCEEGEILGGGRFLAVRKFPAQYKLINCEGKTQSYTSSFNAVLSGSFLAAGALSSKGKAWSHTSVNRSVIQGLST